MMMNIGIDSSAKLSSLPKKISGSSSRVAAPSNISRNPAETINRPTATDTPEKSTEHGDQCHQCTERQRLHQ